MNTDLFNNNVKLKINNKNIIKSISDNQIEIINSIISLYCKGSRVLHINLFKENTEYDTTYKFPDLPQK